ncbi:hypothetical protein FSP39_015216 [Pinctada imbricata]|uniref:G-protein coupled receptors family 1 profile domain-containing protein n=1 Tax=Pinctada imbricata TaxID=66713 RepID=A0AA88YEP4_PINIB|nr:hypothetical protein FSP39_015216 [Pinctada imbricata]
MRGINTSKFHIDMNSSEHHMQNYSEIEDLLLHMGQKRRDMVSTTILLLVYSLIFFTGTVGNICTCIVIVKNKYMHTATNFYLFSLAISDVLILLFGLPFEAYSIWEAYPYRFGEFFCIFKAFLTETTSYASIITITAFTIERYIAICFPLKSHRITDLRRSAKIIMFIWAFAAACALPYPIHTRTFYFLINPETDKPVKDSFMCNIPKHWHSRMRYMFQVSTFIFFVLPMTVIIVLYVLIVIALRKTTLVRANSEDSTKSHSHNHSMRTVIRMLFAVVVAFFLCWAPFHVQRLYTLYENDWTEYSLEIQSHLFYVSGVLYFVSSTVNPILYNVMSRRYRQAFKETIFCCFAKRMTKYERSLLNYHSMRSASCYRGYRRKTTPEYQLTHIEHSSFHDGYLSRNIADEIQSSPAAIKLLAKRETRAVQFVNGHLQQQDYIESSQPLTTSILNQELKQNGLSNT